MNETSSNPPWVFTTNPDWTARLAAGLVGKNRMEPLGIFSPSENGPMAPRYVIWPVTAAAEFSSLK